MYSIKINYGLDQDRRTIFTTKKELKKAFKSEKEFEKYLKKIDAEIYKEIKK